MIIDTAERILRYVEIDGNGKVLGSAFVGGILRRPDGTSRSEEELWGELKTAAAARGHTLVRLCNHNDCGLPEAGHIQYVEGRLSPRPEHPEALNGIEFWDAAVHERAFVQVHDQETGIDLVLRLEPGEWTPEIKSSDLWRVRDSQGNYRLGRAVRKGGEIEIVDLEEEATIVTVGMT